MPTPTPDLATGAALVERANGVVSGAARALSARGGPDEAQQFAYDLAHAASAVATADAALSYGARGELEGRLAAAFLARALRELRERVGVQEETWGLSDGWFAPLRPWVESYGSPAFLANLAETPGDRHLGEQFTMVADVFHRFAEQEIRPHAEHVHRTNGDIPDSVITGLAELGGFGLSVPEAYGGFAGGTESDYLGMVIATEELSWGSLGIGGSLITRPEILTRALVHGGTESQKKRWLPLLASGAELAAVAVTEPDFGSDVANLRTTAQRVPGGWAITGTKTWCTFAARATLLMVLARTDPDRRAGHRGLSLFLVPKPVGDAHGFVFDEPTAGGGRIEGRPIDTIGYRGMHSYEVSFDRWFVPDENLVGEADGLGRGFYLQMAGFENGRLQTAARAIGVMQAAYDAALAYAAERTVFGQPVLSYELSRVKLGTMAATIQAARQSALAVARQMAAGHGALEASMAKAYVCRSAEWVTREAMQLHGGMGYAEEYPVSRYFLDARVLSIFEGADETLCLKVIARRLGEGAG